MSVNVHSVVLVPMYRSDHPQKQASSNGNSWANQIPGWRPRSSRPWMQPKTSKMLLVFGCIGTDFCKIIRVLHHFSKSTRLSSCNFWNLAKICKFCDICKIFAEISQKLLIFQTDFLRKFWDCSGAKGCKSCRAWKMLSNAYFLAKFRFDTAENEPAKNLQNFANFPNFANPDP